MKLLGSSFLMLLLVLPFTGNSQEDNAGDPEPVRLEKTRSWKDLKSKSGVKVQYKYVDCHDDKNDIHKANVMLRFENTTQEAVTVEWDHLLWYEGTCKTCNGGDEYHKRIEIGAGEVLSGDCSKESPGSLKIFSEFLKKGKGRPDTKLTGIRLKNMKVD